MSSSQGGSSRSPTLVGMPRTRLGRSSIGLAATFLGLFVLWIVYVAATPMARPTFFSDPLHAVLLLGAAAAAITGGIVGALALVGGVVASFWWDVATGPLLVCTFGFALVVALVVRVVMKPRPGTVVTL